MNGGSQRWRPLKGEDRTEIKKETRRLRCTLLNGSTWSTEKNTRTDQRKVRYLFVDRAQIEEGGIGGAVQRRLAAGAARITDGRASNEDSIRQEEFLWQSEAVVGAEDGAVVSISGDAGIIAQAWVNVRGGLRVLSVFCWHSEGWTPRRPCLRQW